MVYVYQTWLAAELRRWGIPVAEVPGWQSRGRPHSTGSFAPFAVGNHHTGTGTSDAFPTAGLNTLINGRSDLPGPLCQLGNDYLGRVHVIAAGRANHAGKSNGAGPLVTGDGNWQMIGIEHMYNGTQPMSPAQYRTAVRMNACLLTRLGRDAGYALEHAEWSLEGKWDMGGVDMGPFRFDVVREMTIGPTPAPPPTPPPAPTGDDEDMETREVKFGKARNGEFLGVRHYPGKKPVLQVHNPSDEFIRVWAAQLLDDTATGAFDSGERWTIAIAPHATVFSSSAGLRDDCRAVKVENWGDPDTDWDNPQVTGEDRGPLVAAVYLADA